MINREKIKIVLFSYLKKEKIKERNRKYYLLNRDKILKQKKEYYLLNKDKYKQKYKQKKIKENNKQFLERDQIKIVYF